MIPTIKQCFEIMEAHDMPEHIRAHSVMVAKVARIISKGLIQKGLELSLPLVTAGALLHDIGKYEALKNGGDHSEIGRRLCMELGMDQVAEMISKHVVMEPEIINGPLGEIHLVYYSDKRVNHHRVVSLEERLGYILQRYGARGEGVSKAIKKNFEVCKALEKRIFRLLEFGPSQIEQLVSKENIGGNP